MAERSIRFSARAAELEKLWDEHVALEFSTKDADLTIETMIDDPYVNHIPTMTGGIGKLNLRDFYRDHFISKLPDDTKSTTVSRTVSETRLVEEMVFSFTHDCEIDFLLPGVAPTGKYVEVPLVAIVTFEGDKIANEHIYWDQASVLVQIGLLDQSKLPVCGAESAKKLVDKTVPFRQL
jgi:carboxymethylenebutenolidase